MRHIPHLCMAQSTSPAKQDPPSSCLLVRVLQLISRYTSAEPPSAFIGTYGSTDSVEDMAYAWDGGQNFGCMCDSTWPVGLVRHYHYTHTPTGLSFRP